MKNKDGLIVGLLGIIAGLLLVLAFQMPATPDAQGQTTAAVKGGNLLMATGIMAGSGCSCWIYDAENQKLVVYGMKGSNLSGLVGARNCKFDFQLGEYPKQRPSVSDVQKLLKKKS